MYCVKELLCCDKIKPFGKRGGAKIFNVTSELEKRDFSIVWFVVQSGPLLAAAEQLPI